MTDMTVTANDFDFSKVHDNLQSFIDKEILPCASSAILRGQDLLDVFTAGHADIDNDVSLRTDHIMRMHSTTKLFTTTSIMMLIDEGKLALDDTIEKWMPQLANRKVLKPGATNVSQIEDANGPITLRQLLSHSAGLTYGVFDPGTLIFDLYQERKVNDIDAPLSAMIDALEGLPLVYQPGTSWEYSVATDVLGHLVELISDMSLAEFFEARIFTPLGMTDTGFHLKTGDAARFAKVYLGADLAEPLKPGLTESPGLFPMDYSRPPVRHSGGAGLLSTLPDIISWIRSFLPGGHALLKPETIQLMMQNQLAKDVNVNFVGLGEVPGTAFGLGGAIKLSTIPGELEAMTNEYHWGGVAGTHWWINPDLNIAALVFTQREMAFWHPFYAEFKRGVYEAMT